MSYTIDTHRHRFSTWAAGNASRTSSLCRFSVNDGRKLLETTNIEDFSRNFERNLFDKNSFDTLHREWRNLIVSSADENKIGKPVGNFTHGVAAKLINVYLKMSVICVMSNYNLESDQIFNIIHPPIDSTLLESISREYMPQYEPGSDFKRIQREFREIRWSKLSSEAYEKLIMDLRILANGKPLWTLEEYWKGYRE